MFLHKYSGDYSQKLEITRSEPRTAAFETLGSERTAMTVVAFDFDGTLSDSEMTVLLGEQFDSVEQGSASDRATRGSVADRMEEITERAMNDEIAYAESLRQRCALLEGLPDRDAQAAFDQVRLRPGAAGVVRDLRAAGAHVAILTGGFERGVEAALDASDVDVDTVVANRLPVADGELAGEVEGPLIEGTKDDALAVLAAALGEELVDTVAVGDGANDLPMLDVAGLAVGFAPKPAVEPVCDVVVESVDTLRDVLGNEGLL
jgi:phosphoserine phosphatase